MSFSVALRVDSGTFLYSLGRRRVDKELETHDRLANSTIDTTKSLELDMCLQNRARRFKPPRVVNPAFKNN